jgi:polar amino acid transport system substrate-binding protein
VKTIRHIGVLMVAVLLAAACSTGTTTSSSSPGSSAEQGSSGRPSGVPAAGQSPVIDRMYQAGEIKVGVLAGPPWLIQSTTGGASTWSGSSWVLAEEVSKAMGLPLKVVDVGQDTKITSVQTGAIDISITSLSITPERQKVVDFVVYSVDGFCWFALQSNDKVNTIADFDKPLVDAEVAGGAQMQLIPAKFPNLVMQPFVTPPGEYYALEPILTGKADIASFDSPLIYQIKKQYPQLKFIPSDPAECVSNPQIPGDVGWAIQQDPVFLSYLQGIEKPLQAKLDEVFNADVLAAGK